MVRKLRIGEVSGACLGHINLLFHLAANFTPDIDCPTGARTGGPCIDRGRVAIINEGSRRGTSRLPTLRIALKEKFPLSVGNNCARTLSIMALALRYCASYCLTFWLVMLTWSSSPSSVESP